MIANQYRRCLWPPTASTLAPFFVERGLFLVEFVLDDWSDTVIFYAAMVPTIILGAFKMPLLAFDHVNIRTIHLDEMVAWYERHLDLRSGPRPEFAIPGAWLYLGDVCLLHLIDADPEPMAFSEDESLRMEHIAFRAEGMAEFIARLEANGVPYKLFPFEALKIVLVFIRDPDGNRIHVDFPMSEQA
ncbi:Glyoxalase-like domain protein [Boseongicola aestuarii]|uniref:Glyoxalase-like domain protein n=1 Tax=Boseongicola aestuarii TaxID=1470561 RepID=A0A238IYU4_9RHOB|nr:Glyoxalase-like domain protein [Boseongicola aestuarii]